MTEDPLNMLPDRLGLPRGRSALPGSEVAASQRARIMQAVTDEVAESGFHAATVAAVTHRAHVSRTSFYQSFADKEEAFAAAHLEASEQRLSRIRDRSATVPLASWQERLRIGVEAYLENFESAPAYAYSFLVELHGAGERLWEQRDLILERHASALLRLAELAAQAGARVRIPERLETIGVIGATEELTARDVRSFPRGSQPELSRLVDPITRLQTMILTAT